MHPAALFAGFSVNLAQRLPEPQGTVADGQFGTGFEAPALEIEQQLPPALRALAVAIRQGYNVLVAKRIGADDHQNALFVMVHARRKINPVGQT